MAELLFITPAEITATSIIGGNVDPDRYVVNIAFVQLSVIEPLLGTELYDKIISDLTGAGLTGDYLEMFNDYIKPITKHESIAEYIETSNYLVENGGTFKHTAENRETTQKADTQFLAGKYHSMAQMYVKRFQKWMCKHNIQEFKRYQDKVNAQKVSLSSGIHFQGGKKMIDNDLFNDYYYAE